MLRKKAPPLTLPIYNKVHIPEEKPSKSGQDYSFLQYLLSSKSILARLFFSLVPPLGSFQTLSTDFEGTVLSIFLLTCVLFHRVGKNGEYHALLIPTYYVGGFSATISLISILTHTNLSLR